MTDKFTQADIASCYRVLNLMALVRSAASTIEEDATGNFGGLAAGIRECSRIVTEVLGDVLDKIEIQVKDVRS